MTCISLSFDTLPFVHVHPSPTLLFKSSHLRLFCSRPLISDSSVHVLSSPTLFHILSSPLVPSAVPGTLSHARNCVAGTSDPSPQSKRLDRKWRNDNKTTPRPLNTSPGMSSSTARADHDPHGSSNPPPPREWPTVWPATWKSLLRMRTLAAALAVGSGRWTPPARGRRISARCTSTRSPSFYIYLENDSLANRMQSGN
jgi:hypothetical protein